MNTISTRQCSENALTGEDRDLKEKKLKRTRTLMSTTSEKIIVLFMIFCLKEIALI